MTNKEFQLTVVSILDDISKALVAFGDRILSREDAVIINSATSKLKQAIEEKHRDKTLDEKIMELDGKEARVIE
jgi:hypothetical protein